MMLICEKKNRFIYFICDFHHVLTHCCSSITWLNWELCKLPLKLIFYDLIKLHYIIIIWYYISMDPSLFIDIYISLFIIIVKLIPSHIQISRDNPLIRNMHLQTHSLQCTAFFFLNHSDCIKLILKHLKSTEWQCSQNIKLNCLCHYNKMYCLVLQPLENTRYCEMDFKLIECRIASCHKHYS